MKYGKRLSGFEIFGWAGLGVLTGLVTGFALSEWVGGVSQPRVKRIVTRRHSARPALTPAACARAAAQALGADPALHELGLQATAVAVGVVELHGWVSTRALRARAGTVTGGVAGIDRVVNSILVRGEDDLNPGNVADQSA
ncbi:MAG TPA: BON domain-containing protein [Gemmatimonadales bacterium]|nr:BON domain-containing protein [Gemmatimonadales bacterium]